MFSPSASTPPSPVGSHASQSLSKSFKRGSQAALSIHSATGSLGSTRGGLGTSTTLCPPMPLYTGPKLLVGVCALEAKARSKPMRHILNKLIACNRFEAVIFGDKVILDEDIEEWPDCDYLISFFSAGFPLQKAINYIKLRGPYCINDLEMQEVLFDRRLVLAVLDAQGIPTPKRLMAYHHDYPPLSPNVKKSLEALGVVFPIEETTVRQIDDDTLEVDGRTLSKPFVEKPVSGEDHNIYIYFPEKEGGGARKLFRKVGNKSSDFDPDVVAVRGDGSYIYEEFLNVDNAEDVKVYTIGENFAHAETRKSPVVDGFVRRNSEGKEIRYITELSAEEKEIARKVCRAFGQTVCGFDLLRTQGRSYVIDVNGWSFVKGNDDYYAKCAAIISDIFLAHNAKLSTAKLLKQTSMDSQWRIKAFMSVMRHGDRTPKQKMKFYFSSPPFTSLLNGKEEEIVFKTADKIEGVGRACDEATRGQLEDANSLNMLRSLLDLKGGLEGTKIQIKPIINKVDKTVMDRIRLVFKWGGEFTHSGLHHSKDLGINMRKDFLIMSKGLLDDVKIYSSSERRVIATSDIFARTFLESDDIDGHITVSKEMLDDSNAAKEQMEVVKARIMKIINNPADWDSEDLPLGTILPTAVKDTIGLLERARDMIQVAFQTRNVEAIQDRWCCGETPYLFRVKPLA